MSTLLQPQAADNGEIPAVEPDPPHVIGLARRGRHRAKRLARSLVQEPLSETGMPVQSSRGKVLAHTFTKHAEVRMRQRRLRDDDLVLLLKCATQVTTDAYLLTRADTAREIAQRKREIQQLARLNGCKVVVKGGTVLTCYPSSSEDQKRTLRKGRTTR